MIGLRSKGKTDARGAPLSMPEETAFLIDADQLALGNLPVIKG
jgi:hypothetical protein